ncbi:hypothetical protein LSTR_LSTR014164 [Laodelphax striatellus]|uniref:Uncharacterized protein n=1 Tax=Laodelphax striatellus TaxID=195883 RepID=A0A482X1V8_LAOST|nr:hypothetical protein LSTR_LSTR014164 [Laodelphax striatellus]
MTASKCACLPESIRRSNEIRRKDEGEKKQREKGERGRIRVGEEGEEEEKEYRDEEEGGSLIPSVVGLWGGSYGINRTLKTVLKQIVIAQCRILINRDAPTPMIYASISSSLCLVVCFLALISISTAATDTSSSSTTSTDTTKNSIDRNSNTVVATAPAHQNDDEQLSFGNMLSVLGHNGGFIAAGVLALSAIAAMVMPMFGLRFCSLIGTCDGIYPAASYASGYANDAAYAGGYGQAMYSPSSYQKRSIEYIGPILKALSSAYDKYGKASAVASTKKST